MRVSAVYYSTIFYIQINNILLQTKYKLHKIILITKTIK